MKENIKDQLESQHQAMDALFDIVKIQDYQIEGLQNTVNGFVIGYGIAIGCIGTAIVLIGLSLL